MTREEINSKALEIARELDSDVEEGSEYHNMFRIAIRIGANDSERRAYDWIRKNYGSEAAAQFYLDEVE